MIAPRLALVPAAFLVAAVVWAADAQPPALDFGKKDVGRPKSPEPGRVVASGRVSLPEEFADPQVEALVRSDPVDPHEPGWAVHKAGLKDGKWSIDVRKLPAGTYRVWLRCKLTRVADDSRAEPYFPDDPEKAPYPYTVTVK